MDNKFDELWYLFVKICNAGGILSFNKSIGQKQLSWKLKLHSKFCVTAVSVFVMTMLYTLLTVTNNFVVTIFTCAGLMIYIAVTFGPIRLTWEYEKFIEVIAWCRGLHEDENIDHNVQQIAKKKFDKTFYWSMKVMKYATRLLVLDAFFVTVVFAAVAQLLPGDMLLAKYRAPMPFILPVKNQDTWVVFFVNTLIQFCGNYVGTVLGGLLMSIFISIFMHFMAYLDVILEVIDNAKDFNKIQCSIVKVAGSNDRDADLIEVLREIDEKCVNQDGTIMNQGLNDFDYFIQVVVDMLADFYR